MASSQPTVEQLQQMTISELKETAKNYQIDLKGITLKPHILSVVTGLLYFELKKADPFLKMTGTDIIEKK